MGGAERLMVDQVTEGSAGVRYVVGYARADKTHFVGDLERAGVKTVCLGATGRGPTLLGVARLLGEVRPDVVHSHSPLLASVARVLTRSGAAGARVRHVTTEHNRWQSLRLPTRLVNALTMPLDAWTSRRSDARWSACLGAPCWPPRGHESVWCRCCASRRWWSEPSRWAPQPGTLLGPASRRSPVARDGPRRSGVHGGGGGVGVG
jgi:hypothetical protein